MVQLARVISKQIGRLWSDAQLYKTKSPVFLPFYHTVSTTALPHIKNYPYLNPKEFEAHLDYILKYFNPISLDELSKTPRTSTPVFHLSFDDGLRACSEMIAPILLRKGIPATFFINSGFVDNKALFHRYKASLILNALNTHPDAEAEALLQQNNLDETNLLQADFKQRNILDEAAELLELDFSAFLEKEKPYLTTNEILQLHKKGFAIGGHSHKHPEFWKISEKKQLKHIRKSMQWINKTIQPKIKAFAFPFTDHGVSKQLFQKLKEQNICDISFGTAGLKHDPFPNHFQRSPMETSSGTDVTQLLRTEYAYYRIKALFNKNTIQRK